MGQGWVNSRRVPGEVRVRGAGPQLGLLTGAVVTAWVGFGDGATRAV